MKVGVIGCGGMGTTHYLSLKALSTCKNLEVVALADCRKEYLEKAASYFPNARTYPYGMELIQKEELDLVHICLPSYLHVEHAVAAMEKKMNVLIEKPVCLTKEEGELILEAEKKHGVKVMVGHVLRFTEEYRYLKKIYETKKYGKLKSIVMQRLNGDVTWGFENWFHDEKKSGSVVLDLHIHDVDFLLDLLGEPDHFDVRSTTFPSGMTNQIITTYQFGNTFATAEGSWDICSKVKFQASYRAYFDDATLYFHSNSTPSLTVYKIDGTVEHPNLNYEYNVTDNTAGINISNLGPYYTEIKYFIECIQNNLPVDTASLSEGVRAANLARKELDLAKQYNSKK